MPAMPSSPLLAAGRPIRASSPMPRRGPARADGRQSQPRPAPEPGQLQSQSSLLCPTLLPSEALALVANGDAANLAAADVGTAAVVPNVMATAPRVDPPTNISPLLNGAGQAPTNGRAPAATTSTVVPPISIGLAQIATSNGVDQEVLPGYAQPKPAEADGQAMLVSTSSANQAQTEGQTAPKASQVERLFSRGLTSVELVEVAALLEPNACARLRELVQREYTWAMNAAAENGTPNLSASGKAERLGYSGALIALRQLSYLNGLPALDSDTACKLFDIHTATARATAAKAGGGSSKVERRISIDEFEAVFIHLLRAALESTPRGTG